MSFERRRVECRAASRRHADEEDGHRGDLPSPEHSPNQHQATNFSLPLAQAGGHLAQSSLGDESDLYPHGAGLRLSLRRCRLV